MKILCQILKTSSPLGFSLLVCFKYMLRATIWLCSSEKVSRYLRPASLQEICMGSWYAISAQKLTHPTFPFPVFDAVQVACEIEVDLQGAAKPFPILY